MAGHAPGEDAVTQELEKIVSYTIYHSPNAYLGVLAAEQALAGLPVAIERRPIYIPRQRGLRVADLTGGRESPTHSSYHREDCARWAERYGIPLTFPPSDWFAKRAAIWEQSPFEREELPARAYYAAVGSGKEAAFDRELFEAAWVRGLDVNEEDTIVQCATRAGLEPEGLMATLAGDEARERAREALRAFDEARCPGVPTWVFRGQRFWGKDRVEFLAYAVRKAMSA
jgi:2-hydroxychromene-2-carboxylate isomerase